MGAMTNAMGSIGGSINKVGRGAVGGVKQVGGQMGVPGMGGKPQPPGAVPGQPPGQPGQMAVGPTAATAQPGEGGAPPGPVQASGPAGPQAGGPGGGAPPPFLPGGLPGMLPQLQKSPGQLTAQGALGKQPAQTTLQKMMGGGGFARIMRQPQMQQAMQAQQQPQQPQGIAAPNPNFPVDPRFQF